MTAYISCPMSESFNLVLEVEEILKKKGYKADYWKRNEKYNKRMSDYDIFVLIPEDNMFDVGANKFGDIDLSRGCSSEYENFYIYNNHEEIYIAYTNQSRLQIYKFDTEEFKGIPGTNLKSIIEQKPLDDNTSSKIFDACY
jgi:hypothetical protein